MCHEANILGLEGKGRIGPITTYSKLKRKGKEKHCAYVLILNP